MLQMKQDQIKNITDKQYRDLKKYIRKIAADFDMEDIHQFRVTYKKLRAFLRMISVTVAESGQINISKMLKKAYHVSGVIRDLQMQLRQNQEASDQGLNIPLAYFNYVNKEIEKLKPGFLERISERQVNKSKKKTDLAIPVEFSVPDFNLFIQKKRDVVNAVITAGHLGDKQIHKIRKNLKDLFYDLKIYEWAGQEIISKRIWKGKDEPYFYQLLEELGSFQDKCIAISLLKTFLVKRLKNSDRKQLERIQKIWIENKRSMKKLLVMKLRSVDIF
jgi:CHAD domain-containing protein